MCLAFLNFGDKEARGFVFQPSNSELMNIGLSISYTSSSSIRKSDQVTYKINFGLMTN